MVYYGKPDCHDHEVFENYTKSRNEYESGMAFISN
jgi:hypothetical protein